MKTASLDNVGTIVEIRGVVIDAVFPGGHLPSIYNALEIELPSTDGSDSVHDPVAEVQQHVGDGRVRAIAMDATDGLSRGLDVIDTRGRSPSRSARSRWAGSSTCSVSRSTRATPLPEGGERWQIHRDPPRVRGPVADGRDLRDRHQGDRSARAVRQGRQGRPVRRRRRGQDRADSGADQQHRLRARRSVGVRRSGRAHPRGQRPLPRDDRVRRDLQDRAGVRPDERAARRPAARGPVGADDGGVLPR